MPRPRPTTAQVTVRASTYEKLLEYARRNGEQAGKVLDGLIIRYLDEQEKLS